MWVTPGLGLALVLAVGCSDARIGDPGNGGGGDGGASGVDADVLPGTPDAGPVDDCPGDWTDCGMAFRRLLTFDNSAQAEALADFPVLVRLDPSRFDYARARADGADLRFYAAGGQPLAHEIERFSPGGVSVIWVRVPQIGAASTTDGMWMYYGDPGASDGQDAAAVWSAGYRGVWHLSESPGDPAPQARDSSGNANHGTASAGMDASSRVESQLGFGLALDGASQHVLVPHSASLALTGTAFTLSAWFRLTVLPEVDVGIVLKSGQGGSSDPAHNYHLGVQKEHLANTRVLAGSAPAQRLNGTTGLQAGVWYHMTGVYDGASLRVYLDGALESSVSKTGSILSTLEPLVIGRRALDDNRFFPGVLDEVRVAAVARSPAWIAAQYRSMTDAFVTYGAEQAR
jgi:hypothetical protein